MSPSDAGAGSAGSLPADELSFASVPDWLARADALIADGRLDLSGVRRADSAGLALLLELSRRAKQRGQKLVLQGANPQLTGLAAFFGLEGILCFTA